MALQVHDHLHGLRSGVVADDEIGVDNTIIDQQRELPGDLRLDLRPGRKRIFKAVDEQTPLRLDIETEDNDRG